ncbi:MAG: DUF2796 domain-containing protein [Candidatus Methylophosphatis roskildensis]
MIRLLATAVILAGSGAALAQHAHEHGVAHMELALDGGKLSIRLESPLDNLVGFEHAPRNEKQRGALARMTEDLKRAERLFDLPGAAACKLVRTQSAHPHAQPPAAGTPHHDPDTHRHDEAHAELQASWEFDCSKPEALTRIGVRLFDLFRGIRRIKAQSVSHKGQGAASLSAAKRDLLL